VSRTALGPTQPPIRWLPRSLSLGVKRPGREADNSPPSSAEIKTAWSYTSTPQYVFMAWCLVKHRDNFTFYLYLIYRGWEVVDWIHLALDKVHWPDVINMVMNLRFQYKAGDLLTKLATIS
jgi:hypothetical protein